MHRFIRPCAHSRKSRSHFFVWGLLFASLGATGQSNVPVASPPASAPGSLPVISPPVPTIGIFPWLVVREDRFFTDSEKLRDSLEKSERPKAKLEDFRIETERSRVRLEQDRRNNAITKEIYLKDMERYGEAINLYRDLKR